MKTVIDKHTGEVLFASLIDVVLADNEIAIDNLLTENFNRPFWDFDNKIFYDAQPKVWSKEAHLAEINALHKSEFDRKWLELEYDGRWEVVDAARDASNEYHEEAKALMAYWWNGWDAIKAYSETLTENNFIEPLDFVNGL